MSNYAVRLNRAKKYKKMYPFESESSWLIEGGPPQYTKKNCARVSRIYDRLVAKLISLGKDASDEAKIKAFRKAVEELNRLNKTTNLIESMERDQMCDLLGWIAGAAGLSHSSFPTEEGAAGGRDW
jgi:hypothetical protein